MKLALGIGATLFAAAACGGGQTPPPAAAPPPGPPSTTVAAAATSATVDAGPAPPTDHHREFTESCAKQVVSSPDYCECAWGELRKIVTDDEMSQEIDGEKRARLRSQMLAACASKLPESAVREEFAKGCTNGAADMKSYCDCTWTEFRKQFSSAELADDATVQSERFRAAHGPVVKTCGGKMPERVSKEAFMKGCVKDASADAFCECAWTELRKMATPAAIDSGNFDQKATFAKVDKVCSKLRPPAPK
jgi:hypothetical protein